MSRFNLPLNHRPYIDKYFLRAKEILQKEDLNPIVKAQVFIRNGNVELYGVNEAIEILKKYGKVKSLYALPEGAFFQHGNTIMVFEAYIQDIIDLETMYLGVLSAETTKRNDNRHIDLKNVRERMSRIVDVVGGRPVSYFGARHWRYDMDAAISNACFKAGATNCSTDAGAASVNQKGIGTIPHALEAIYHWASSERLAVVESTKAFDRNIDKKVPRIALVDYANREILDSLEVARALDTRLYGIRIDTCGENIMQGSFPKDVTASCYTHLSGRGVTILGVYNVRRALDDAGYPHVKILLSSGFGNHCKVREFVEVEKRLNIKLFDGLGVGGVFDSRMATMDIIEVDGLETHKTGRNPKPMINLKRVI